MSLLSLLHQGIKTKTAADTEELGFSLAKLIPEDTVLALHGDLGAGKTTFIRGLARGWEIHEPVKSPTFNLYAIYAGKRQLIHLDAYRLTSMEDLDALMIHDFMISPWCFAVEWPTRIAGALPEDAWKLQFEIIETGIHRIKLSH